MPIVSLTTDFGDKDYSVSAIKASLKIEIPEVQIIDISHLVSPSIIPKQGIFSKMPIPLFQKDPYIF